MPIPSMYLIINKQKPLRSRDNHSTSWFKWVTQGTDLHINDSLLSINYYSTKLLPIKLIVGTLHKQFTHVTVV